MPPLGIFSGLDLPYAPAEAKQSMYQRWEELSADRNGWKQGVLQELTSGSAGPVHDGTQP